MQNQYLMIKERKMKKYLTEEKVLYRKDEQEENYIKFRKIKEINNIRGKK